ncbi:translation repressor protein [Candidatus Pacearchaeota archaeon]|nr:translation repressor protein [Candidatus Pacearchaeota archaeon]
MEEVDDIFDGLGVEIELKEDDDFLKVRETLTRIGVSSRQEKKIYQSCHILHKRGRYAIMHFKELFILDGLESTLSDGDIARRNTIVKLLHEWELVEVPDPEEYEEPQASLAKIKIISHKDKDEWELIPKYHIGKRN